jgi:selenide,water dikinase
LSSRAVTRLVLVGGGHSHAAVLRAFGERPPNGVELTLISRHAQSPYSGMLPGAVAGRYSVAEANIDLVALSRFAHATFVEDEVVGVDPVARTVALASGGAVAYDWLSINTGSTPSTRVLAGDAGAVIPVKPIDRFLARWNELLGRLRCRETPVRIAVVGGGAGGVELALAVRARLESERIDAEIHVLTAAATLLDSRNRRAQAKIARIVAERGIRVHVESRVVEAARGRLRTDAGRTLAIDATLWVTQAEAPAWIERSGLAVDPNGFLLVDEHLQSVSNPTVFGAGDVASMQSSPRPKSGVFAVRQGAALARNLRRAAHGRPLAAYRPQREFLSLIGTGDGSALAVRGPFAIEGRLIRYWKDWLDRRFVARYRVDRGTDAS